MSFDSRKTQVGQQLVTIIEMDLDRCKYTTSTSVSAGNITTSSNVTNSQTGTISISGGNASLFTNSNPYILWDDEIIKVDVLSNSQLDITGRGEFGTAAVSHTSGSIKLMHSGEADRTCYGFSQTCSSPDAYNGDVMTFRFPNTQLDLSQIFYNGFESVSHSPVKVDPGQSIGKRAGLSVTLIDSVDNDVYVPYADRRTNKGTLFTKMLARHPNIENRVLRERVGFDPLNYNESNFITREYIIDNVNLNKGKLSVSALDPLILTEDKKAKAPLQSKGRLSVAIDDTSTQIVYKDDVDLAYGDAGQAVRVRIDSETIDCTVNSTNVLDIVQRGVKSEIKDHDINATVQKCLHYESVNVIDIIEDLINNYTDIDSRFLDDYTSVKSYTSTILLTATISKPTEVKKLLDELVKCGDLTMYYKEETQKIVIKPVVDATAGSVSINEDEHIKRDSVSLTREPDEQKTRYSIAWAPNDLTKTEDEENFSIVYQAINAGLEDNSRKAEINEKDIFFNRWLTNSDSDVTIGTSIAQRVLDRSEEVPEQAKFILDIESVFNTQNSQLELGTVFSFETSRAVEVDGSNKARNHQVISMRDLGNMQYQITSRLFQDPILSGGGGAGADFVISSNKENYDLSTEFSPTAGHYIIVLEKGVTIGSTDTLTAAMTTGTQAAGVTFTFYIYGSILGMGGAGGDGGDTDPGFTAEGTPGLDGGTALILTVDTTLHVGSGALWGGGGGAAGGTSEALAGGKANRVGNGGSGGQGYGISLGGNGGRMGDIYGQDGENGNRAKPGELGGVSGGAFGEDGDSTDVSGGLSGLAYKANGNSVTVASGNNNLNIKGRRE